MNCVIALTTRRIWPSNSASSIFDKTHFFKNLALAGSLLALSSDAPKVRRR